MEACFAYRTSSKKNAEEFSGSEVSFHDLRKLTSLYSICFIKLKSILSVSEKPNSKTGKYNLRKDCASPFLLNEYHSLMMTSHNSQSTFRQCTMTENRLSLGIVIACTSLLHSDLGQYLAEDCPSMINLGLPQVRKIA